jgi:hypothetical protein
MAIEAECGCAHVCLVIADLVRSTATRDDVQQFREQITEEVSFERWLQEQDPDWVEYCLNGAEKLAADLGEHVCNGVYLQGTYLGLYRRAIN